VHIPVLLHEVLEVLNPKSGNYILDNTFGGGGHSRAILEAADCKLVAVDRDPLAKERAALFEAEFPGRFEFIYSKFSEVSDKVRQTFDGVLYDLGVSSFQLDEAERGFSFLKEARLDMRMSDRGISAFDVVNSFKEEELAEILWAYGDESKSRKIASAIVKSRHLSKIETTTDLAKIVHEALGFSHISKGQTKIDSATKTFQAIRIFVNDELNEINEALKKLPKILNDQARIAIISFHSLEDRIIKNWARSMGKALTPINKEVIRAKSEEISENPRSRSSILRGFVYNKIRTTTEGEQE
jgi:16S rRNA (cytosine1402-N4)-methyltransferase